MKRMMLISMFLFVHSSAAFAQRAPEVELFGGYSYFRSDGGGNLHGWNASITQNLNNWAGVVLDISGHYGSDSFQVNIPGFFMVEANGDSNIHTLLTGPRFSYRKHRNLTPFAHALFGVSRTHVEANINIGQIPTPPSFPPFPGVFEQISDVSGGFSMAIGGGLDVRLNRTLALRLVQGDYLLTRINGNTGNNARVSTGFVFRF